MNVQIRTAYGEMSFDMSQDKVMSLLSMAITYAKSEEPTEPPAVFPFPAVLDGEPEPPTTAAENMPTPAMVAAATLVPMMGDAAAREKHHAEDPLPEDRPKECPPKSRLEKMFGDRTGWNMPAQDKERDADGGASETYRGFLYIECEDCGKVKGYCAKQDMHFHRCECGHDTYLKDLRPVHVACRKCGAHYRYKTNKQGQTFTIDCLRCGAPVDMELGKRGTAYVTADEPDTGGVST